MVPEVGIGFGGLRVGSDLLLYDGGGYGVLCLLVGLHEGVDGRLVTIHPIGRLGVGGVAFFPCVSAWRLPIWHRV